MGGRGTNSRRMNVRRLLLCVSKTLPVDFHVCPRGNAGRRAWI